MKRCAYALASALLLASILPGRAESPSCKPAEAWIESATQAGLTAVGLEGDQRRVASEIFASMPPVSDYQLFPVVLFVPKDKDGPAMLLVGTPECIVGRLVIPAKERPDVQRAIFGVAL